MQSEAPRCTRAIPHRGKQGSALVQERGEDITQIRKALDPFLPPDRGAEQPSGPGTQAPTQPRPSTPNNQPRGTGEEGGNDTETIMNTVLQMSQQHREEMREQHQETTTALRGQVESLKRQLLLLAGGRTPEEIREGRVRAEQNTLRLNHLLVKHTRLKTLATELTRRETLGKSREAPTRDPC